MRPLGAPRLHRPAAPSDTRRRGDSGSTPPAAGAQPRTDWRASGQIVRAVQSVIRLGPTTRPRTGCVRRHVNCQSVPAQRTTTENSSPSSMCSRPYQLDSAPAAAGTSDRVVRRLDQQIRVVRAGAAGGQRFQCGGRGGRRTGSRRPPLGPDPADVSAGVRAADAGERVVAAVVPGAHRRDVSAAGDPDRVRVRGVRFRRRGRGEPAHRPGRAHQCGDRRISRAVALPRRPRPGAVEFVDRAGNAGYARLVGLTALFGRTRYWVETWAPPPTSRRTCLPATHGCASWLPRPRRAHPASGPPRSDWRPTGTSPEPDAACGPIFSESAKSGFTDLRREARAAGLGPAQESSDPREPLALMLPAHEAGARRLEGYLRPVGGQDGCAQGS